MRELRVTNVRFNSDTVKKLHTISDLRCREEEKATLCGILVLDFLYAPDLSINKSYLDPMRVRRGIGQNILDDSSSKFSCSLVLLEND
jgi:hypothetical protein